MTGRRALLSAVLLVLLALPCAPAWSAPDPAEGFGLNVQSLVRTTKVFTVDQWPSFLGLMTRDRLGVARADALWNRAEPTAPDALGRHYDWSSTDVLAGQFAAAGLRWEPVLDSSPAWARSDPINSFASPAPEHRADYAAFAAALVARYGQGGTFWAEHPELPARPMTMVEIWNEPNTAVHWGAPPDAAGYADLYARARAAVKAQSPSTLVAIGGIVWNDDVAYLKGVLAALGPNAIVDGVASHPYAPTVFSIVPNVQRMRRALDDAGRRDVPLLLNELGWPAAYDRAPSLHGSDGPVADGTRAGTMALAVDALASSTCGVGNIMIYDLVEDEQDPTHVESLMGLYRRDGSSTATSAALRDAVARYRAAGGPGVPVPMCGARGASATRLLGLRATATRQPSGCQQLTVTYRGLPIEEAQARVLAPYTGVLATDADGHAALCPQKPGDALRLVAEVPGVARSNTLVCGTTCRSVGAGAACVLRNVARTYRASTATVARTGLRIRIAGCRPQEGGRVDLRARLVARGADARALGLSSRTRASIAVGAGRATLQPGAGSTLAATLTRAARQRWSSRHALALSLELTAVEGATRDTVVSAVLLRPGPAR